MKTLLTIIPLIASITACIGPRYTVDGDVNVGTKATLEVVPSYKLFRTKNKLTKPYYRDCLVDSEHIITKNVLEAYQNSIENALASAGIDVVEDGEESAQSHISIDLHIYGNGDYGSLRFYTGVNAKGETGGELNQKEPVKNATFKALRYMPSGIGKYARNDYCADLWAQGGEEIRADLNDFMGDLAEHHVNELAKNGALPRG